MACLHRCRSTVDAEQVEFGLRLAYPDVLDGRTGHHASRGIGGFGQGLRQALQGGTVFLSDEIQAGQMGAVGAEQNPSQGRCHLGMKGHGEIHSGSAGLAEKRSEEHTSELQSLMSISYAVFCLKKKIKYRQ